jgi:hypothetical protein
MYFTELRSVEQRVLVTSSYGSTSSRSDARVQVLPLARAVIRVHTSPAKSELLFSIGVTSVPNV